MPKFIYEDFTGTIKETEVKENDNNDLIEKAEIAGVIFGCTDGRCATCRSEILVGKENLTEITQNEKVLGINENEPYRLICQCKIKKGAVKARA